MNGTQTLGAMLVGLAVTGAAQADVLYDNFAAGDNYDTIGYTISDGSPLNTDVDQGENLVITGGDYYLDGVDAAIGLIMGQNIMNMWLFSDDGGVPGVILETATAVGQMGAAGDVNPPVEFVFSGTTLLTEGTTYWFIASSENDTWAVWGKNLLGDTGDHAQRQDLSWDVFPDSVRGAYRVHASPVPAPSSLALLTLGGLAIRRRRA